ARTGHCRCSWVHERASPRRSAFSRSGPYTVSIDRDYFLYGPLLRKISNAACDNAVIAPPERGVGRTSDVTLPTRFGTPLTQAEHWRGSDVDRARDPGWAAAVLPHVQHSGPGHTQRLRSRDLSDREHDQLPLRRGEEQRNRGRDRVR